MYIKTKNIKDDIDVEIYESGAENTDYEEYKALDPRLTEPRVPVDTSENQVSGYTANKDSNVKSSYVALLNEMESIESENNSTGRLFSGTYDSDEDIYKDDDELYDLKYEAQKNEQSKHRVNSDRLKGISEYEHDDNSDTENIDPWDILNDDASIDDDLYNCWNSDDWDNDDIENDILNDDIDNDVLNDDTLNKTNINKQNKYNSITNMIFALLLLLITVWAMSMYSSNFSDRPIKIEDNAVCYIPLQKLDSGEYIERVMVMELRDGLTCADENILSTVHPSRIEYRVCFEGQVVVLSDKDVIIIEDIEDSDSLHFMSMCEASGDKYYVVHTDKDSSSILTTVTIETN